MVNHGPSHSARDSPPGDLGFPEAGAKQCFRPLGQVNRANLGNVGNGQGTRSRAQSMPETGIEPARVLSPADFESAASASSATPASVEAQFSRRISQRAPEDCISGRSQMPTSSRPVESAAARNMPSELKTMAISPERETAMMPPSSGLRTPWTTSRAA